MFRPSTSQVSREELREADADWVISDPDRQAVYGSALKLIPLEGAVSPLDLGWPKIEWGQEDEFTSLPGDISTRWETDFNNQAITTPQLFSFGPRSKFLDIETDAGEYQYLKQAQGGPAAQAYWANQVDNATGWTVQTRVQILNDATGAALSEHHHMLIDDGVRRERLIFHETGISFQTSPHLNIRADMTKPREIRIGGRQDDIFVLLDDGRGVAGYDAFTGTSVAKELGFGTTGATDSIRSQWDYMHQFHEGLWVDDRPNVLKIYSTTAEIAISPAYAPKAHVERWSAAYVETLGDLLGGQTSVFVEYRSSLVTTWTQHGTANVVDTIGQFEISLLTIPTAGDGSDEVRFKISQTSTTGAAEPPKVDTITVLAAFNIHGLRMRPHWGHRDGGNTVVLDINDEAYLIGRRSLSENTPFAPGISESEQPEALRDILITADGDMDDSVGPVSAVEAGEVLYRDGLYGEAAIFGGMIGEDSDWSNSLDTFSNNVYGDAGNGVTAIQVETGSLILSEYSIGYQYYENFVSSQQVYAEQPGDGVSVEGHDASLTGINFAFMAQVSRGSVRVTHGNQSHDLDAEYFFRTRLFIFQADPTGTGEVTFTALESGSSWMFGGPISPRVTRGSATLASPTHAVGATGFNAEGYFTPYEIGTDLPLMSRLSGNDGWEVGITNGGHAYAIIGDGSTTDKVTADYPIFLGERRHLSLNFIIGTTNTLQILVDGVVAGEKTTALTTISEYATLTIGDTVVQAEEIAAQHESWDPARLCVRRGFCSPTFSTGDKVFVDNVEVDDSRITHYSDTRKYVSMPPGDPGLVPVYILAETGSPGIALVADRPYRYTYGYQRETPAELFDESVFRVKSPFRVTVKVPKDSIGAAFIQGPGLSISRNVSLTDLSYLMSENLSTYFGGEFPATAGTETTNLVTYANQIDTEDIRISNRSALRRGMKQPTPLYFKYLVGRKRFYLHNVNAITVADIGIIRAGMKVLDSAGNDLPMSQYPWDIEVSKQDENGDTLPVNIFSVTLFTGKLSIPNLSAWVSYNAADQLQGYKVIPSFKEVVNPAPIYRRIYSGTPSVDEYLLTLEDDGTYTLAVWNGS